jgi:formylmethanofuran dehydrogenase subunit E
LNQAVSGKGEEMKSFEELLQTSVERHGHLCPGQVVGLRMSMLGCKLIGLDDPTSRQIDTISLCTEHRSRMRS